MSQGSSEEEMRPEYDIRGGVRGKYYREYTESRFRLQDRTWVSTPETGSIGQHTGDSTIRIGAEPLYQSLRIETGAAAR